MFDVKKLSGLFWETHQEKLENMGLSSPEIRSGWMLGSSIWLRFSDYSLAIGFNPSDNIVCVKFGRQWIDFRGRILLSNDFSAFQMYFSQAEGDYFLDPYEPENAFVNLLTAFNESFPLFHDHLTPAIVEEIEHLPPAGILYMHAERSIRNPKLRSPKLVPSRANDA